jgi:predicted negative regulator of RcsB-dependent stress response
MAIDDQEEYEQGEKVRNWLRNNGGSMIGGIAVGLALIAGWQWWQRKQEIHSQEAANAYTVATKSIAEGSDEKRIDVMFQGVRTNYSNTPYASLASLRLAAHQMDRGDAKGALATLEGMGPAADPALADIVRLREGRLLLLLNRPADALTRIASVNDEAYAPVGDEIRGDAEHALGHDDAARRYYTNALLKLPPEAPSRELLEMKLTEAGGVAPKPEAKKA